MFLRFLNHSDLGQTTAQIADLLQRAGGRAMLVGGTVRDLLRRRQVDFNAETIKDVDIEVYGLLPEQIQPALAPQFAVDEVGASFAVFKLKHHNIDLSLPRSECKTGPGHRGFHVSVDPYMSFVEAAGRRDLTINAIMFDLHDHQIIDPYNGQQDLAQKILRHVSYRFREDNLRVLRIMQFAARFDFTVAAETVTCCQTMSQEDLPKERLATEWEKLLLHGIKPSRGLQFLHDCDWLHYYPELSALLDCQHNLDDWNQTLRALDFLPERRTGQEHDDLIIALALLCQHFGNARDPKRQELVKIFIRRLWQQTGLLERVLPLLTCQVRFASLSQGDFTDQDIRQLAVDTQRIDLLHIIAECAFLSTMPQDPRPTLQRFRNFLQRAQELGIAQQAPRPIIMGRHLQEMGLTPGKHFQQILQQCYQAQIAGSFTDLPAAINWLQQQKKVFEASSFERK